MALHKLFAAVLCVASVAAEDITVTLPDGTQLLGTLTGNIASFKGVPFAQPPVGNLRWAPPAPWVNRDPAVVVDATQFGSPCKQVRGGTELGLENCLFLNVYVDLNKTGGTGDQRTPVGLYIHGGSYVNGAGSDYDGTDFVNFWNGSLIVVTTNYRLNVFGFCGSEQLRAQDPLDGSAGNYGVQDQRMAMEWVYNNIGAFGGNKDMLTIYGESAGAGSVSNHLAMRKSWKYFSAAILESGSFSEWITQPMFIAQEGYSSLVDAMNCSSSSAVDEVACMLGRSTDEVFSAAVGIDSTDSAYETPFNPTADGVELATHPWIALSQGDIADVPIMHGSNTDEGTMFYPLPYDVDEAALVAYWRMFDYSDAEISRMLEIYVTGKEYPSVPIEDGEEQPTVYWWAGQRMLGDVVFSCANKYTSETLSLLHSASLRKSAVYFYHFEYLADGSDVDFVQHTAEIPFIFHLNDDMASDSDKAMADLMSTYWGNFMQSHDPNKRVSNVGSRKLFDRSQSFSNFDLPHWSEYDVATDENIYMRSPDDIGITKNLKDAECRFVNPRTAASIRSNFQTSQ